jgi:hypothetical protein
MADDDGVHFRFHDPLAKAEEERLEKKRFESGFAFELNHPPILRSRLDHFGLGHGLYEVPGKDEPTGS